MNYKDRKKSDRDYDIYERADMPGMWRIRLELYPEHSGHTGFNGGVPGWYGGRVMFSQDTTDYKKIKKVADDWHLRGIIPEG
jgi:hypothetical protein